MFRRRHAHHDSRGLKPKKRRSGCLITGCAAALGLGVFVLGLLGFLVYILLSRTPKALPEFTGTLEDYTEIMARVNAFTEALDQNRTAEIILTEHDCNTLLQFDERLLPYRDHIRVRLNNSQFEGDISFPANLFETLRPWMPYSIFLNGRAVFVFSTSRGLPSFNLVKLEIKERTFPEVFVKRIREENLLLPLLRNPQTAARAGKVASIEVREDKLIIRSRRMLEPGA